MIVFPYLLVSLAFFTCVLLFTKRPRYTFDKILGFLIIAISIQHINHIVKDVYFPERIRLFSSGAFPLLFGPLLYLYAHSITGKTLRKKDILHILPFLCVLSAELFVLSTGRTDRLFEFGKLPRFPLPGPIYLAGISLSTLVYTYFCYQVLSNHKKYLFSTCSNIDIWRDFEWVGWMVWLNFIMNALILLAPILLPHPLRYILKYHYILIFLFTVFLCYFGLRQTFLFAFYTKPQEENKNDEAEDKIRYKTSGLKEENLITIKRQILDYMEKEKPFLDYDFNLETICRDLNISKHHASQAINIGMNTNFYNLVNEFRIKEVLAEIHKNPDDKINYLNLAFAKGFNSKATFNRVFKISTGKTPSEYQKTILLTGSEGI